MRRQLPYTPVYAGAQMTPTRKGADRLQKRFFPWKNDEELKQEYCQLKLSIKAFYETVYLPRVPRGKKRFGLEFFYDRLRIEGRRVRFEKTFLRKDDIVECFDISNEVTAHDCESQNIDQVHITFATGVSVDFYPGSASEAFVTELLRQNGVKI